MVIAMQYEQHIEHILINVNGRHVVYVVAVEGGRGDDWAAYIGACDDHVEEKYAVGFVRDRGRKLPLTVAKVWFPVWATKFPLGYRR